MEHIKIELRGKAVYKNGWPLLEIKIDDEVLLNIEAKNEPIILETEIPDGDHKLQIHHYGKNHKVDGHKSFTLHNISINDVGMKQYIHDCVQYPILPPWDQDQYPIWKDNLHMGHNGMLVFEFKTPIIPWFRDMFKPASPVLMQESTPEVIEEAKKLLRKYRNV